MQLWNECRRILVHRANWSPMLQRLIYIRCLAKFCSYRTYLTTRVPGICLASIHFPSVFCTCSPPTSSCQRIVKHWEIGGRWQMDVSISPSSSPRISSPHSWNISYSQSQYIWHNVYLLRVCTDANLPNVSRCRILWRVMEDPHDRSRSGSLQGDIRDMV